MHLETLLYMLVQSDKVLAPPGPAPDFEGLARKAQQDTGTNDWIDIPARTISLGMDDPEDDEGPDRYFGWDNEKPRRHAQVPAFQAKSRPITNQEYAQYLHECHQKKIPASWASSKYLCHNKSPEPSDVNNFLCNGHSTSADVSFLREHAVRTVFGLVPLQYALHWPVLASFDELSRCAKWMNGRIPTAEEAQSIYGYVDELKLEEAEKVQTKTISAVNG